MSYGKQQVGGENRNKKKKTSEELITENNMDCQHWWKVEFKEMKDGLMSKDRWIPILTPCRQRRKTSVGIETNQIDHLDLQKPAANILTRYLRFCEVGDDVS